MVIFLLSYTMISLKGTWSETYRFQVSSRIQITYSNSDNLGLVQKNLTSREIFMSINLKTSKIEARR